MLNHRLSSLNNANHDPLLIRIEELIGEHYRVRFNLLSQQYEVSERGAEQWQAMNGHFLTEFGVWVKDKRVYGVCLVKNNVS